MNGNGKKPIIDDIWAIKVERKLNDALDSLREWVKRHGKNREVALTLTKLEEAQMWFAKR